MFKKPSPEITVHPSEEKRPAADDVETVVGPSVNVEGDFSSEGNIVVKGTVSGSVKTSKLLTVEKGAAIFASVKAGVAVVSGSIKGNVRVSDRLELSESAQISGDIHCKVLTVAPGALIRGKVVMKGINFGERDKKEEKKENKKKAAVSLKPAPVKVAKKKKS